MELTEFETCDVFKSKLQSDYNIEYRWQYKYNGIVATTECFEHDTPTSCNKCAIEEIQIWYAFKHNGMCTTGNWCKGNASRKRMCQGIDREIEQINLKEWKVRNESVRMRCSDWCGTLAQPLDKRENEIKYHQSSLSKHTLNWLTHKQTFVCARSGWGVV